MSELARTNRRLLLILPSLPPPYTPEAEYDVRLVDELDRRKIDVHIATRRGDVPALPATVHASARKWDWSDAGRLARVVRTVRPDAVLLHYAAWGYGYHPMVTFVPTLLRRLAPRTRVITLFENAIGIVPSSLRMPARIGRKLATTWAGRGGLDYLFGTLLRDSHTVIVLSDVHGHQLLERSPESAAKIVLMPAPPSVPPADNASAIRQRIRQRHGIPESSFVFVSVAYVAPDKGIHKLLSAFKSLLTHAPDSRLVIVQIAPHPSLEPRRDYSIAMRSLAQELALGQTVTWTNEVSWGSRDVMEHLAAADACILPHDYGVQLNHRGFAAAAVQGLPTIAIRGQIPERQLRDGEHLIFCPPASSEVLARAAADLMRSPELRSRLSAGAKDLARACYSWEAVANGLVNLAFGERASRRPAAGVQTRDAGL